MVTAIRARRDVAGCGCLDCRDVDAATLRRSNLGTVVWAVRLARTYPSIPVLALAFVLAGRLLDGVLVGYLPGSVVELAEVTILVGLGFLLRAYVSGIAADELTGDRLPSRGGVRYWLGRVLALGGVVCGVAVAVASVLLFLWALQFVALFAFVVARINPMTTFGVEVVAVATIALPVASVLFVLFKCWFAMEACVVGHYGPVDSLRVSWRVTTSYRGKLLAVLVGSVGSVGVFSVLGLPVGLDGALGSSALVLDAVASGVGQLTTVVWYGMYAHLYVQGVLEQ